VNGPKQDLSQMKIVHVFKDFYPPLAAGITRYLADVSDAMALRGHEVEIHVAGVKHSRRERLPSGVVVHRHQEFARALSMPLAPGLIREVRTLDADVIHVHLPNPIGEIGVVLNRGPAIVVTFHAQLGKQRMLEPFYGPLRNALLKRATSVLVSGLAMASVPELDRCSEKVHVLPYGVSPRFVGPGAKHADAAGGPLRLLFAGRLVYYKGVDVLLRALVHVSDATLKLVGDGANRAELEALALDLGVADRTQFLGSVPDSELAACYSAADVFVLPSVSRAEAFGMAMTEAMANGVPAISTALGTGTDWVNLDGQTGLVVPPNDVGSLATAIEKLRDGELRARLGTEAAHRAGSLFSFDEHINQLEKNYREAMA
jgi:glycosyltransferase involved in cell wall biosynthesis